MSALINREISRWVKMSFRPEEKENFLALFEARKTQIRNFPGCTHLQLLQDPEYPNVLYTYSCWKDKKDLENYRNSELFKLTWEQTKSLFTNERAEAKSFLRIVDVEK